jgi:hypothetical protein
MAGPKTPEAEPTTPTAPSAPKSAGRRKATASKEKEPAPGSMPQGDVDFLIACLQNTVSGNIVSGYFDRSSSLSFIKDRVPRILGSLKGLKKLFNMYSLY